MTSSGNVDTKMLEDGALADLDISSAADIFDVWYQNTNIEC
jgi:hypothetical protein